MNDNNFYKVTFNVSDINNENIISEENFIDDIKTDNEKLEYLTTLIEQVEEDTTLKELQDKVMKKDL